MYGAKNTHDLLESVGSGIGSRFGTIADDNSIWDTRTAPRSLSGNSSGVFAWLTRHARKLAHTILWNIYLFYKEWHDRNSKSEMKEWEEEHLFPNHMGIFGLNTKIQANNITPRIISVVLCLTYIPVSSYLSSYKMKRLFSNC